MKILDNYFDTILIPDYCSKQKLEKFYDYYLYNLNASPYKMKWVALEEIEMEDILGWECVGDMYLSDSKDDKSRLAMDIYENGTYFPLFVFKQEGGLYKLRDGAHRLYAMRMLVEKGLWEKGREVLISTDEDADRYDKNEKMLFYLPVAVKDEFKENYSFLYKELYSNLPLIHPDLEKEFAEYRTSGGRYLAVSCMSLLLRNALFEYKQKTGVPIKPSPVINVYENWVKWRGY